MAALTTAPAALAQGKSPAYGEALTCAALTQAAAKIGKGTKQESVLFDQSIFWSMAAADAGRAAGKTARAVDGEVATLAGAQEAKLRGNDGGATGALAACAARVPAVAQ